MTNIRVYKRVCQLKDYLENMEFQEYSPKEMAEANELISKVFEVLDRRGK